MAQFDDERIEEIFHAALEVPESERSAFVAKACEGDSECIREVISLLRAHAAKGLLDTPVVGLGSASDPEVGTAIDGRYLIERELRHGGMSKVYVAIDNRLNDPVVVKVLSRDLVQNPIARQHFEHEVEALKRLRHSRVVRVTDRSALPDGRPFIVMDYVNGDSLRSQIRPNEGMDLNRVASILTQVGDALEYVHQNEVIHRDVKPENIMLGRDNDRVVLIDFGIAKVIDSVVALTTVGGASAGTLAYMSPEQLRGPEVKAGSDVYSMAVVAYEMITGRRPFAPQSHADMLALQHRGVRAKPTILRPGLSRKAEGIILRALSFDLKYRYQSAKRFGDELAAALKESSGIDERTYKKWIFIVAGVLILALLLSYAGYRFLVKPNGKPSQEPQGLLSSTKGFNYWLTIQRTREGKDYEAPYKSNGKDKFDNGDRFQLNVKCLYSGYLYVFNEGPLETDSISFRLVYPKKTVNNESASVGANQTVELDWNSFRGPAGTDNYWMVWSAFPLPELESAKKQALERSEGGLTGQSLTELQAYLKKLNNEVKARAAKFEASQEVQVRKPNDIVITFAQFEHR